MLFDRSGTTQVCRQAGGRPQPLEAAGWKHVRGSVYSGGLWATNIVKSLEIVKNNVGRVEKSELLWSVHKT